MLWNAIKNINRNISNKTNRSKLQEIYLEAKQNGRYPINIQQRLFEIYIQKRLINEAFGILHEIASN